MLIPALGQMSATGMASAPCFRMNAFIASESLDAFMVLRSYQPGKDYGEKLQFKTIQLSGIRLNSDLAARVPKVTYDTQTLVKFTTREHGPPHR